MNPFALLVTDGDLVRLLAALWCHCFGHVPFTDAVRHPFSTRRRICRRCGALPRGGGHG